MADNLTVTEGAGKTIAADEISSVLYQRVKLIHGADGVNDGDVSSANGLPVVSAAAEALAVRHSFDSSTFNNTWQSFVSAPASEFRYIKIINDCLITIQLSLNATNPFFDVLPKTAEVIDLRAIGLKISGAITIKGATASTGNVIFNGLRA